MTTQNARIPDSLLPFAEALQEAMAHYQIVHFNPCQDALLKAFVDIIHGDHSLNRFFQVCVTVPLLSGSSRARFYLYEKGNDRFLCVCDSAQGVLEPPQPAGFKPSFEISSAFEDEGWLLFPLYPIHSKTKENVVQPDSSPVRSGRKLYDPDPYFDGHSLLGLYGIFPAAESSEEDGIFFQTLTRWIGNKLNNRLIARRHLEHLRFLNALGRDIGHNIIVPNMYLKHLLRQVEKQIEGLKRIEQEAEFFAVQGISTRQYVSLLDSYRERLDILERSHRELLKHHNQITLFLESLFREQHFSQGHLVVQPTRCMVEQDIILPQLDLYRKRFRDCGITVDKPANLHRQEFPLMVDVGLLSQVYANLFSNAVKYTREIIDHQGKKRKAVAYGAEEVEDFPEPGRKGIKFNVFTTAPPLSEEECRSIFEEGQRANNSLGIEGSGHGLDFIRRVVEVHGGRVGCEPTPEGNNFYFILPISPVGQPGEAQS